MIRLIATLIVALGACLLVEAAPVSAATITVETTTDELQPNGACSLREAIRNANADIATHPDCPAGTGADDIVLRGGTYQLTLPGQLEDAAASGDLDLLGNLTITGNGAATTIVEAGPEGAGRIDRVFDVQASAVVQISGLTVRRGNPAPGINPDDGSGGGIRVRGNLTLDLVTVIENRSSRMGGGIRVPDAGGLTMRRSAMIGNLSESDGGGISSSSNGTFLFDGVTVAGNVARVGGGMDFDHGTVSILNSTISANRASLQAGGIVNQGADLTIDHTTIVQNEAPNRGGIDNNTSEPIRFHASIIALNTAPNCGFFRANVVTSLGSNLANDDSCLLTAPGDQQNTDPGIGPLRDNGGPTQTHALLPGSLAIDAVQGTCPAPANDQRGVVRAKDGDGNGTISCDIGAFERAPGVLQFLGAPYTVPEAGGFATITVARTGGTDGVVEAIVTPSNGTATAPADFGAAPLTVSFADGDTTNKTVNVPIVNDAVDESDETVNLTLSVPTGGVALGAATVLTIVDDDTAGVTVTPTGGLVTTEAGGTAQFSVRLNTWPTQTVTIALASSDTTEGNVSPASLTFQPDASALVAQTVTVTGIDDLALDGDIAYLIVLSPASSGDLMYNGHDPQDVAVTNVEDDSIGGLAFSTASVQVPESAGSVTLTIQRNVAVSGAAAQPVSVAPLPAGTVRPAASPVPTALTIGPASLLPVTVGYATVAGAGPGAATPGQDYTATSGTLSFGLNETTKTVTIPILPDAVDELSETFTVTLSAPSSGASLGAISTATVTITDVDTTPCQTFLSAAVPAGTSVLPVLSQAGCSVGDTVAIDPGLSNEERGLIVGFGSIAIQQPTTQAHGAGAVVIRVTAGATGDPAAAAQNSPGDDDTDSSRKETEDERRQRERTNRGGRDDEYVEGNVMETRCDQDWPAVVIANRDGQVEVRLVKEAQAACRSIQPGDYLEADGEKQHELLFDADSVEIRRNGERVK